ncbi:hypothetical protein T484DRAFT_1802594 [Baffinella frigidus]|nr:hypothetical protein T484DRAFT_1802594 [Cryptophyta sp. CCMP2293]
MSLLKAKPLDFDSTWAVLEQQVARLITDLSEGISHADFVRLHTFIYKLATIPPAPAQEPQAGHYQ